MNMAERIQYLRKTKGLSQEELANKMGVSRQAVSKWESEQSSPDLEKIIIMSNFFGVTTDYILKGMEPVKDKEQKSKEITSKVLFISHQQPLLQSDYFVHLAGGMQNKRWKLFGGQ